MAIRNRWLKNVKLSYYLFIGILGVKIARVTRALTFKMRSKRRCGCLVSKWRSGTENSGAFVWSDFSLQRMSLQFSLIDNNQFEAMLLL